MLTTLCGLLVAAPSLVMLIELVLDARMVCTEVICVAAIMRSEDFVSVWM